MNWKNWFGPQKQWDINVNTNRIPYSSNQWWILNDQWHQRYRFREFHNVSFLACGVWRTWVFSVWRLSKTCTRRNCIANTMIVWAGTWIWLSDQAGYGKCFDVCESISEIFGLFTNRTYARLILLRTSWRKLLFTYRDFRNRLLAGDSGWVCGSVSAISLNFKWSVSHCRVWPS